MSTSRARALAYANQHAETRANRRKPVDIFSQPGNTPAYQQNPRLLTDDVSAEKSTLRHKERKLLNDEQLDVVDSGSFASAAPTGHAPAPARITVASTPRPEFLKIWSANSVSHIPTAQYEMLSWYTPNCICLFETLAEIEMLLNNNKQLEIIALNYFSLPKTELPIAGPLFAFFANITSCLLEDDQFNYVYPTIPTNVTYTGVNSGTSDNLVRTVTVRPAHHLFPRALFLAAMLRKICLSSSLPDDMFDSKRQFVPFDLAVSSGPDGFAGGHFAPHTKDAPKPTTAALLSNPALSRPFPEDRSALEDIHVNWPKAFAYNIPSVNVNDSYDPKSLKDQTLLGHKFDWFKSCSNAAAKQAMFFSNSTNLSQVPVVGNTSCLIESRLTFTKYPSIPATINEWYPDIYSNVTAKFRATSPELSSEMMESAIFAVSNASLKWKDPDDQPIGSYANKSRHGPYLENQKYTLALEHDGPVLTNFLTMIKTEFFQSLSEV
ncbi:hypothetical protein K3495_g7425 [Podosphaera aphanis]|nr:hypothetical protein K3495_g7425 [Podosphaera aphanis]